MLGLGFGLYKLDDVTPMNILLLLLYITPCVSLDLDHKTNPHITWCQVREILNTLPTDTDFRYLNNTDDWTLQHWIDWRNPAQPHQDEETST